MKLLPDDYITSSPFLLHFAMGPHKETIAPPTKNTPGTSVERIEGYCEQQRATRETVSISLHDLSRELDLEDTPSALYRALLSAFEGLRGKGIIARYAIEASTEVGPKITVRFSQPKRLTVRKGLAAMGSPAASQHLDRSSARRGARLAG